jgi:hypothetical protein
MPGYIVLPLRDPYLGLFTDNVGWPVPIDAGHTRFASFTITRPRSALQRVAMRLWYACYYAPLHVRFLGQDRRLEESQLYGHQNRLSATDIGLVQWRHLAPRIARQSGVPVGARGNGGTRSEG